MALDKLVDSVQLDSELTSIANAIRAKTGGNSQIPFTQMGTAIAGISTGITPSGSLNITQNGTYDVTTKSSAIVQIPAFTVTNLVPSSLEDDGTPYNNGLGYKTGYTLSATTGSPSTETARSERAVTGFIPAVRNDVIRVINAGVSGVYSFGIWIFDSDKNLINAYMSNAPASGSYTPAKTFSILLNGRSSTNSDRIAYIRVVYDADMGGNIIVTKNQNISPLEV